MAGLSYSSAAALTENPISEGGKWSNGLATGLDWHNVRSDGTKFFGTQTGGTGFDDSVACLAPMGTWDATQVVQAIVKTSNRISPSASTHVFQEVELLLRFAISGHSATGYEVTVSVDPNNEYIQINRWNGTLGSFTLLATAPSTLDTVNDGDIIKASICGKHICVYVNDTLVCQADDTTYSTGSPGIGFYYTNDGAFPAFLVSDFGLTSVTWSNFGWAYGDCTIAQALSGSGSSLSTSNAMSAVPPAGARYFLVVMVSKLGTTPMLATAVTDASGRTWTKEAAFTNSNGTYTSELSIWTTIANGATMTAITVAASQTFASGGAAVTGFAVGGMATATAPGATLDFFQAAAGSTSPMSSGVSSGTTDRSGELKIAAYGDAGNNSNLAISTPDAKLAQIGPYPPTGSPVLVANSAVSQIASAFGAAGNAGVTAQTTWTSTVNAEALVMVAVFRAAEPTNSVRETHAKFPKPNMRASALRPAVK